MNWLDTRIRGYADRETQNMKHNLHFEPQTDETTRYTFTVLFCNPLFYFYLFKMLSYYKLLQIELGLFFFI